MRHEIKSAIAGTVGGLAATALMIEASKRAGRLPARLQPIAPAEDPGEHMVGRFERALGRELPRPLHRTAAKGLQWGYGTIGPLALGVLAPRLGLHRPGRALAIGAGLGAAVFAAGYLGWLPATGLVPKVRNQRPTKTLSSLVAHIGYGVLAALPLMLMERRELRSLPIWRKLFV